MAERSRTCCAHAALGIQLGALLSQPIVANREELCPGCSWLCLRMHLAAGHSAMGSSHLIYGLAGLASAAGLRAPEQAAGLFAGLQTGLHNVVRSGLGPGRER